MCKLVYERGGEYMHYADLSEDKLRKLRQLEEEIGVTLLAVSQSDEELSQEQNES
jgi:hypothetical protein